MIDNTENIFVLPIRIIDCNDEKYKQITRRVHSEILNLNLQNQLCYETRILLEIEKSRFVAQKGPATLGLPVRIRI